MLFFFFSYSLSYFLPLPHLCRWHATTSLILSGSTLLRAGSFMWATGMVPVQVTEGMPCNERPVRRRTACMCDICCHWFSRSTLSWCRALCFCAVLLCCVGDSLQIHASIHFNVLTFFLPWEKFSLLSSRAICQWHPRIYTHLHAYPFDCIPLFWQNGRGWSACAGQARHHTCGQLHRKYSQLPQPKGCQLSPVSYLLLASTRQERRQGQKLHKVCPACLWLHWSSTQ